MRFWFPVLDHPNAGGPPWYSLDPDGFVYPTDEHPEGESTDPMFRVESNVAYATADGAAWFTILGSMVSPASDHPAGVSSTPWYQMRER